MIDLRRVRPQVEISVDIASADKESLLVDWLGEILYQVTVKKTLLSKFNVHKVGRFFLEASAYGERIDRKRHHIFKEIKAVTYHDLKIRKNAKGYAVKIVFDI